MSSLAQVQAVIGGSASSENLQQGFIVGDQDPAPKRPRISTRVNTYNEGRALPQATGERWGCSSLNVGKRWGTGGLETQR